MIVGSKNNNDLYHLQENELSQGAPSMHHRYDQVLKLSIPEATNRIPESLISKYTASPADAADVVAQAAEPGVCCIVLRRTPPMAVAVNTVK